MAVESMKNLRLSVKSSKPLSLPKLCVITGETATETHTIHRVRFYGSAITLNEVCLPFSSGGWLRYSQHYPYSRLIFIGGLRPLMRFGFLLSPIIFLWIVWGGPICLAIAIIDWASGKRQLVKVHKVRCTTGGQEIYELDMTLTSKAFAQEFCRLNPGTTIDEGWQ